jgi:hypothetical protein
MAAARRDDRILRRRAVGILRRLQVAIAGQAPLRGVLSLAAAVDDTLGLDGGLPP